jgi:hypothetical protein
VWNTQEVSSKLATSSSSSEAAGETAACNAIEQRSPHGRHGEREQRGQPLSPAASRRVGKSSIYLSIYLSISLSIRCCGESLDAPCVVPWWYQF